MQPTLFHAAADLVVAVHALFVVFVVLGGLLVVRWPRVVWLHVPAATWGAFIEFQGWICPLTPLKTIFASEPGRRPTKASSSSTTSSPCSIPRN